MDNNKKNIKYFMGLVIVLILAYFIYNYFKTPKNNESFSVDGSINGGVPLGGIINNTYDIIQPSVNTFADIVAPSNPGGSCNSRLPLPIKSGLDMDYRDLLPDVNTSATSYDIDVADPEVFMYRPSIRAAIKNRQWATADNLRGDLLIPADPCNVSRNGWFSSRYSNVDSKVDTFFSAYGKELYSSLTGQRSYPSNVVNEELILDAPADELSMDAF